MSKKRRWRWLQRVTGVHRIHHARWSYGWKMPLTDWAYFPTAVHRDRKIEVVLGVPAIVTVERRVRHGWKRVLRRDYHDCTATGIF